jgi:AraC-like DNA-binding protein
MVERVSKKKTGKPKRSKRVVPYKPIDWAFVDNLLMSGASVLQISSAIGMHHETFYRRIHKEKKMTFTEYALDKRRHGDSLLFGAQFKMAMKGDKAMLIWLGKQRLGQREDPHQTGGFNGELKEFIAVLKNKYESDRKAQADVPAAETKIEKREDTDRVVNIENIASEGSQPEATSSVS